MSHTTHRRARTAFFVPTLLWSLAICLPAAATSATSTTSAASATAAPGVPGPSFEQVISLRQLGSIAISPDGSSVAFEMRSTDWGDNRYDTEIWLARNGQPPFQLTRTAEGSSTSPQWSPDGRWLAFLAERDKQRQIYVLRPDGGEAQAVTAVKEGVSSFRWSPTEARIAFTSEEPESAAKRQRKERYGAFAVEDHEFSLEHLWVIDVRPDPWPSPQESPCSETAQEKDEDTMPATGEGNEAPAPLPPTSAAEAAATPCAQAPQPRRLTSGDFTVESFTWSPDGTRIAFEQRRDPLINSYVTADISVVDVASGTLRPLVTAAGADGNPIWSPDSRWVLYVTTSGNTTSDYYQNPLLAKVPAEGGAPQPVPVDLDEDLSQITWTPTGVYLLAWQGPPQRRLFRLDPDTGATEAVSPASNLSYWQLDASADGRHLALVASGADSLPELYVTPSDAFQPQALTTMTHQLDGWQLGSSEMISWQSQDGARIEGVLHKPRDFQPGKRYPLLVVIHGGPTGIDTPGPAPSYVYPIVQWLAKGALVLRPNYRGSAGYGAAFRALNVRNLGVGDAWDVLSGVDYLIDQGLADPERLGAMGWSQGGYISAFLTTTSDRFKAISVGAGITDWVTYYVNTDIHPFTRQYLQATPWDDPEIYAQTSPMTFVRGARTPTLIQHGEFDRRVPIPNAYQLYQALQDLGVDSKLVVYKGFGHGISKPKERLAATWHNWQWFARYLWGEEVELPLAAEAEAK